MNEKRIKPRYECELISIGNYPDGGRYLVIRRLVEHERLGPPKGGVTHTSKLLMIDYTQKFAETENSVYFWYEPFSPE